MLVAVLVVLVTVVQERMSCRSWRRAKENSHAVIENLVESDQATIHEDR